MRGRRRRGSEEEDDVVLEALAFVGPQGFAAQGLGEEAARDGLRDGLGVERARVGVGELDASGAAGNVVLGHCGERALEGRQAGDGEAALGCQALADAGVVGREGLLHAKDGGEVLRLPVLEPGHVAHLGAQAAAGAGHAAVPAGVGGGAADAAVERAPVAVGELLGAQAEQGAEGHEVVAPV